MTLHKRQIILCGCTLRYDAKMTQTIKRLTGVCQTETVKSLAGSPTHYDPLCENNWGVDRYMYTRTALCSGGNITYNLKYYQHMNFS